MLFGLLFAVLLGSVAHAQDIVGCGGFVQSDVPIDYNKIEVKLYTKQGAYKSKTDCAPNNGYFLVAVYDHGDYILKIHPPAGWSFEPKEIELHIDGSTDRCSKGEDLNFLFKGFTINGSVKSGEKNRTPGVTIALYQGENLKKTTTTDENGSYMFEEMVRGEYTVRASHPSWSLADHVIDVSVVDDNVQIKTPVQVIGYDGRGRVLSGGEPIQGVNFLIYSSTVAKKDVLGCETVKKEILSSIQYKGTPLCSVVSQKDGSFVFPTLPTGDYVIVPFYTAQNIVFDVVPSNLPFTISHDSLVFQRPFQVYGFSVRGKVVDTEGLGLEGVLVTASSNEGNHRSASSGVDGKFLLDNVTTGEYEVTVMKQHYLFKKQKNHISPNTPHLSDIQVEKYSLCGTVKIFNLPKDVVPIQQHKVLLTLVNSTDFSSLSPNKDGTFCFHASPGSYKVEVPLGKNEVKAGLLLQPDQATVIVKNKPILDILFTQFRAQVQGTVQCLEDCTEVSVYMTSIESNEKIYAKMSGSGKEISFTVDNLLPGKYKVFPQRKRWCWNPAHQDVEIVDSNLDNIVLQHSGFYLKCSISHNITLDFALKESKGVVGSFELKQGSNQFCLKAPGIYTLTPRSCYKFEHEQYTYDTSIVSKSLTLDVSQYKVLLHVTSLKKITDLKIIAMSLKTQIETVVSPSKEEEKDGVFTYTSLHWARRDEEILVTPLSNEVLFYPDEQKVAVKEACPGGESTFTGREGMFVEGRVTPRLAGVTVTVVVNGNQQHNVQTDQHGKYRVGPLHSGVTFDVSALKEGYLISKFDDSLTNFQAQKLAQITVKVNKNGGEAMKAVLLSLSGSRKYRNNSFTGADGTFTFLNLGPGQYFLKPMQKEYNFSPNSKMIDLKEGENLSIEVTGIRVAFSCTGVLTSLSGGAQPDAPVEAVGIHKCSEFEETTVSDENGHYRLTGLQPHCTYNVRLGKVGDSSLIERMAPTNQVIKMEEKDIEGLDFIVFNKPTNFHITVSIETEEKYLSTLKVILYEEETENVVHTVTPGVVKYIAFPPVPPKKYVVKVHTLLAQKTHEYQSTSASIDGQLTKKHVKINFTAKEKNVNFEPTQSVVALPLAVALVFIVYNYDSVLGFLSGFASLTQTKAEENNRDDDYVIPPTTTKRSKKIR